MHTEGCECYDTKLEKAGTGTRGHIWFHTLCSTLTWLHLSSVCQILSVQIQTNCWSQSHFSVYKEAYCPPCEAKIKITFHWKLLISYLLEMWHVTTYTQWANKFHHCDSNRTQQSIPKDWAAVWWCFLLTIYSLFHRIFSFLILTVLNSSKVRNLFFM